MTAPAVDEELARLYRDHWAELCAWLRRRGLPWAVAEDVAQDAWLRYLRWARGHTWQDRGVARVALLYSCTRSALVDHTRRRCVRYEVPVPDMAEEDGPVDAGPEPLVVEAAARGGWSVALRQAMAELPRRQREALRLVYVEGLLQREAAAHLGINEDAVKAAVHRAMCTLRSQRHALAVRAGDAIRCARE